ncbi:hypothetical protein [Serratia rhizosphaerae]
MAGKSQKYNASINFGASVDPSMTRTLNRMTTGIDRIGTETAQVMKTQTAWQRQMKSGSASTVNQIKHMERATQALINKQEALEKEIRDGVKSGRAGMAFLVEDYKKVGAGIEHARKELERLNDEQENEQKLEKKREAWEGKRIKWRERGENITAHGRATIAYGARALIRAPIAIAGAGVIGAAGVGGGVLALNRKTAEEYRNAKKYGMSYEHYKAGSIMAEQAGLNGENYGDLTEELSNKLGEEGNEKTVNPMLAMIGLNKHLMKGTKQEQFDLVMKRLVDGVRNKTLKPEQAESLADQLMGGEGNKMLTYLIGTKKAYEEVMNNAAELNNITEDEARGALESSQILSNMWTSAETALAGVAGDVGNALRPQLKEWEGQFETWVKNNKAMITNTIIDWVDGGGPKRVVDGLLKFSQVVWAVAEKLEWILPENRKPEDMDTQEAARIRAAEIAGPEADKLGLKDSFWGGATGTGERSQYVKKKQDEAATAWVGKHLGVDGDVAQPKSTDGEIVPVFSRPGNANVNNTHNNQYHFNIVIDGGASEAGAQELYDKFKALTGDAGGSSDTFDSANFME